MRIFISFSLLVAFFVLLTPRGLWHNCEHDDHTKEEIYALNGSHDNYTVENHCHVCDLDLGFFTIQSPFFFKIDHQVFSVQEKLVSIERFGGLDESQFRRGPPDLTL